VPDVSVFGQDSPTGSVFSSPQTIVVEVLCPEDRRDRIDGKIRDSIELRDIFLKIDEDTSRYR
jgi:hypothetical protein